MNWVQRYGRGMNFTTFYALTSPKEKVQPIEDQDPNSGPT